MIKNKYLFFFILIFINLFFSYSYAANNFSELPNVKIFIDEMVSKHQFKKTELVKLFDTLKIKPNVTSNNKTPLEQKSWLTYRTIFVSEKRIQQGLDFWNKYEAILQKAQDTYGVPASIIVATIGMETRYGQNSGQKPVFNSLATLAFGNSPRANFFRKELEEFLLLTREQHLDPRNVLGSYAGAIGQPQFMPSSYRNFAVNFSGNANIDLAHDWGDVIGSIANYYKKNGWVMGQPIAVPVSFIGGHYEFSMLHPKPITYSELVQAGLAPAHATDQKSQLMILRGYYSNEYWNIYKNFSVIKRYNHSDLYAMAVFQLSYYISAARLNL
ncbi:MAG: lytic murein transglycosylase B [Gammaproteobacteria bacterium]|nr:lytic murein transglycosylase B [Gammaproteobacteria bacterium]